MNLTSVLFTSAAEGGKSSTASSSLTEVSEYSGNEWKVTLTDSARSGFTVSEVVKSSETLYFSYSGAQTGENEYISAVVKDGDTITHYAKLKAVGDSASGYAAVDVSSIPTTGTIYVFNEQDNGDKNTDYASELQQISVPTSETVAGVTITANLTNLTGVFPPYVTTSKDYSATLTANTGYALPLGIEVKAGNDILTAGETTYSYDADTGTLTIKSAQLTNSITVTAAARRVLDVSGLSLSTAGSPFTFDGTEKGVTLTGTVPAGVAVSKTGTFSATNVGSYTATVSFSIAEGYSEDEYMIVGTNPLTASWSISKAAAQTLEAVDKTHKYTQTGERTESVEGLMPDNAGTLTYTAGTKTDANNIISSWSVDSSGGVKYTLAEMSSYSEGLTATLPVTISSTNYEDSTVDVVITLTDKDVPTVTANNITMTYNGSAVPASLISGAATFDGQTVAGTWSFREDADKHIVNVADSKTDVAVVFTPTDSANYAAAEANIHVTVAKATPAGSPSYTAITTSGRTLADAALTAGDITPAGGTIAWDDGDATTVAANTSYGWTYTPADTANYETLTGSIELYHASSGGGGSSSGGGSQTYSVTTPTATPGGSVTARPARAERGDTVTVIVTPENGYALSSLTVKDNRGNELELTDRGEGKYSFTMPGSRVTVEAAFAKENPSTGGLPFTDVKANDWFYDNVKYVYEQGLMVGTSATTFSPDTEITRGMIVTILWRQAGAPDMEDEIWGYPYADVDAEAYYGTAVYWARLNGIASGYGDNEFGPDDPITREQLAVILWRYAGSPAASGSLAGYTDAGSVSGYAVDALRWAVSAGIIQGTSGATLSPQGTATRAQAAAMLQRYLERIG